MEGGGFDELDDAVVGPDTENPPVDEGRRMVCVSTDATQTEGDVVDGAVLIQPHPLVPNNHQNNNASFHLLRGGGGDEAFASETDGKTPFLV